MSEFETCKVCGNDASMDHSLIRVLNPKKSKFYCSKSCKYRDSWKKPVYWGIFLIISASFFKFAESEELTFLTFLWTIGGILLFVGYYKKNY